MAKLIRKIEKQAKKRYVKPVVKSEVLNNRLKSDHTAYATHASPQYSCGACAGHGGVGPC